VTDFAPQEYAYNAQVATAIDVPAFWDLVLDAYHRIPAAAQA
jgi:hypothetical protein